MKPHKEYKVIIIILFIASSLSACLGFFSLWIGFEYFKNNVNNLIELGLIGDYLSGTAGVFFTISGSFAIVIAFLAQKIQINLQKIELSKLENSQLIQSFENNFYQLLNLYLNVVEQKSFCSPEIRENSTNLQQWTGKEGIKNFYREYMFKYLLPNYTSKTFNVPDINYQVEFNKSYTEIIINSAINPLDNYFRIIFKILEFIYNGNNINNIFYANIFKAQLGTYELKLLFYYGITDSANFASNELNFKKLAEEFNLFEDLSLKTSDSTISKTLINLVKCYNNSAYGNNKEKIINELE